MNAAEWIAALKSGGADAELLRLYGETSAGSARYCKLAEGLLNFPEDSFPETRGDVRFFSAPGRTELGGNHTDHNRGKVLAAAIQLDAVAVVAPRQDSKVFFRSSGFPDVSIDVSDTAVREEEKGTTESLLRGVAAGLAAKGVPIRGWTANAESTVLPGSGLSSSAALETLAGKIFDGLYGGGTLPAIELAKIAQYAENHYYGKPSGLMDQAASASGGAVAIDFGSDEPEIARIEFDPDRRGYALCVVNTRGSHADLTPDYGAIPGEMRSIAAFFGESCLRDAGCDALSKALGSAAQVRALRERCGDRAVLRAMHFFDENDRVEEMRKTLEVLQAENNNANFENTKDSNAVFEKFLDLVNRSGDSSWELLQNIFSTQYPREQGVALGLSLTRIFAGGLFGKKIACRVHGGGFAGTIQAYIPHEHLSEYRQVMETVFGGDAVTVLKVRSAGAAEIAL